MNVLVVDDSKAMRKYVVGVLRHAFSAEVFEADSGFEAFRILARKDFSLIITDINMPDINGLELIRFLRKSPRHSDSRIVVITSQTTEKLKERIFDLGIDGYIVKPFEPSQLVDIVRGFEVSAADEAGGE